MPNSRPESHRITNLVPSHDTEKDWQFEHAIESESIQLGAPGGALHPVSLDLRASWWEIGDQQASGSCVGWASTDSVARYHFVKANRLEPGANLSPRFTWMASKETDEFTDRPESFIEGAGTSLKAAVDILRKYGSVKDKLLPFHIETFMYSGDEEKFYACAARRKISAYFNLRKVTDNWKTWLATQGPILVGLSVDDTWDNATATHGLLDTFQPGTVRGGHAVAVVGYTKDQRFILRNSWGTAWGDKGYAYASEAYLNAAFFDESYGVTI